MKIKAKFLCLFGVGVIGLGCDVSETLEIERDSVSLSGKKIPELSLKVQFDSVKLKHDTLIPMSNGLFITHNNVKWGVIDSAGQKVLPFEYDGIIEYPDKRGVGIASKYAGSFSLNTGIPRYRYNGVCYQFNRNGLISKYGLSFGETIERIGDYHDSTNVIRLGPQFFLPLLCDTIVKRNNFYEIKRVPMQRSFPPRR